MHHRLTTSALLLALTIPGRAAAYSTQGNHWPNDANTPVVYRIHPDASPEITDGSDMTAIRNAFMTWQSVACSYLKFSEGAWMEPRVVQNDNTNRIYWAVAQGEWEGTPQTLALTYTFYRTADKLITDGDIHVNGVDWHWTTRESAVRDKTVDLETVMFHEIGHFVGLDHSQDPAAAMYGSNNKPIFRGPAPDDTNAICSLYSNGMSTPVNPGMPGGGPGGVGAPCQKPEDCASSLCAQDSQINQNYCTATCSPAQSTCPSGFQCTQTADNQYYCLPPAVVDELCDQCTEGGQCVTGLCTNVPGVNNFRPFCTRACDPTPGLPGQCPTGYICQGGGGTGGVCVPSNGVCEPKGKGGQNEVCYANGGCKPGFTCVEYYPNSGLNFCYYACPAALQFQNCATGVQCRPIDARPGAFACFNKAGVGEPCIPELCEDNAFCAYDERVGVDSALCYALCPQGQAQCPANTQCQRFDIGQLCVPNMGFKYVGDACASNEECASKLCRTYASKNLCTQNCATTDRMSCPVGTKCIPTVAQMTAGLCWPESFTDERASESKRDILVPSYCSCDTTSKCDADCACDPECLAGGCSCRASGEGGAATGVLALVALALSVRRRRRL